MSILFRDSGPRGGDLDIYLKIPDISVLLWTWGVRMLQDGGNAVISIIFKDLNRKQHILQINTLVICIQFAYCNKLTLKRQFGVE